MLHCIDLEDFTHQDLASDKAYGMVMENLWRKKTSKGGHFRSEKCRCSFLLYSEGTFGHVC